MLNASKALKLLESIDVLIVTKNGVDEYRIMKARHVATPKTKDVATSMPVMKTENDANLPPQVQPEDNPLEYGCGCVKTESNLCKKHGRV